MAQVGGNHYEEMGIAPFEYSMANGLDSMQHTVIKYVSRFRDKNGVEDLHKAQDTLNQLIEYELAKLVNDLLNTKEGYRYDDIAGIKRLANTLKGTSYKRIVTTGRGGMMFAANLGYALGITDVRCLPIEECEHYVDSDVLFVDSIVDTGATVKKLHPELAVACLVVREGSEHLVSYYDTLVTKEDGYIHIDVGQLMDDYE